MVCILPVCSHSPYKLCVNLAGEWKTVFGFKEEYQPNTDLANPNATR
jgi:hypothetical protein